jgi:hypothetical protein
VDPLFQEVRDDRHALHGIRQHGLHQVDPSSVNEVPASDKLVGTFYFVIKYKGAPHLSYRRNNIRK